MLGPDFAEKLAADIAAEDGAMPLEMQSTRRRRFASTIRDERGRCRRLRAKPTTRRDTSFDTSFNFGFDFGPSEEISTIAPENAADSDAAHGIDAASFNPFAPVVLKKRSANTQQSCRGRASRRQTASRADATRGRRSASPAIRPRCRS